MNRYLSKLALSLTALATLAAPALAQSDAPGEASEGEIELAKMLEGRVAGAPESCINTFPARGLDIIDGTALVYDSGSTIYVNYTRDPDALDDRDTLLTRTYGSRLCRTDVVTTFDNGSGIYTGNIFLGDFVPFRKAR